MITVTLKMGSLSIQISWAFTKSCQHYNKSSSEMLNVINASTGSLSTSMFLFTSDSMHTATQVISKCFHKRREIWLAIVTLIVSKLKDTGRSKDTEWENGWDYGNDVSQKGRYNFTVKFLFIFLQIYFLVFYLGGSMRLHSAIF